MLLAAMISGAALRRWRPGLLSRAGQGRKLLGACLLLLGLMVLTGVDKMLEARALQILPDRAVSL